MDRIGVFLSLGDVNFEKKILWKSGLFLVAGQC